MNKRIDVEDFVHQKMMTNLKVNRHETYGLYFCHQANLKENSYDKVLKKINLDSFEIETLSLVEVPSDFFICFEQIIFLFKRNDKLSVFTDLYTFDMSRNALEFLIRLEGSILDLEVYGDFLYFVSQRDAILTYEEQIKHKLSGYKNYESGTSNVLCRAELFNGEIECISPLDFDVHQVVFDLTHKIIVLSAFKISPIKPIVSFLFAYEVASQTLSQVTQKPFRIESIGCISKNEILFKGVCLESQSRNDNPFLYKVDCITSSCEQIAKSNAFSNERPGILSDHRFEIQSKAQSYNGQFFQVIVTRFSEKIQSVASSLNTIEIDVGLNTINHFVVLEKGILLIGAEENKYQELYFYDGELHKLTGENEVIEAAVLPCEYYPGKIDGWVIKPAQYEKGMRYPAVLFIHGGPKMIYSAAYNHDMQCLAHQGYFVIMTNPRGSDGRGDDFSNIRGAFAQMATMDIEAYLKMIFDVFPEIDQDRLGITGGSYGGYLTNVIITQTNRFKAAVSERGICNLATSLLTSDIGFYFVKEYMGNGPMPWQNNEVYAADSPIYKAHHVKTPTLFNHGLSDNRCHYTESVMMYQALLYHGIDCELNLYPDEKHGFITSGKPLNRFDRHQKFMLWFNKHLK